MSMFIVWYPHEFNRLHNLHTCCWNSLLYSLISSGKDSAFAHFAAAIASHYRLAFSFHQLPITAGWTEAAWYERLAQHLHMASSVTRTPANHPSTNQARRSKLQWSHRNWLPWPCGWVDRPLDSRMKIKRCLLWFQLLVMCRSTGQTSHFRLTQSTLQWWKEQKSLIVMIDCSLRKCAEFSWEMKMWTSVHQYQRCKLQSAGIFGL